VINYNGNIHKGKEQVVMNRRRWVLVVCVTMLVGVLLVGCEDDDEDTGNGATTQPVDLLPQDNEISGWSKGIGEGDFLEAYDESSLYDIIDGGAVIYINHGMQSAVQQIYYGTVVSQETSLFVFITDQGEAANCEALLQEPAIRPPAGTEVGGIGDEALIDRSLPFDLQLFFRNGRFFVRMTLDKTEDAQAAENILLAFAYNVDSKIP
jgi:hypothetical protein